MHFELHFEPHHFVHFQNTKGNWERDYWKNIVKYSNSVNRIQYNKENIQKYIIIDIDHDELYHFRKTNLPNPNFIVKNLKKPGGHLFYVLDRVITNQYYKNVWQEIQKYFSIVARGDLANKGFIAKNFNNNELFEYIEIEPQAYKLLDLVEYLPKDPKKITHTCSTWNDTILDEPLPSQNNSTSIGNRNNTLFNTLRLFAYELVKKSVNNNDFLLQLQYKAQSINKSFDTQLDRKEVLKTCRSIYNYCIEHKSAIKKHSKNPGVMKLSDELTQKEKERQGALYSAKVKTSKSEMKIKVAILEMQKQGLKINVSSVAKFTQMSRPTITKYKHLFSN